MNMAQVPSAAATAPIARGMRAGLVQREDDLPTLSGLHPFEPLAADEVDLWMVPLPLEPQIESSLAEALSPEERHRAARFAVPGAGRQFIAGRAVLRRLLGHYLGLPPQALHFSLGAMGKPALAEVRALSFNLSHTEGLLLVAVASGMEVGDDVEKVRPIEGAAHLAARYFTARERAGMEDRPDAFLRLWTCRESAVKASGLGVSEGWDALRIVERGRDEAQAVGLGGDCFVRLFSPCSGYVAALAAMAPGFRIRRRETLDLTSG